MPAAGPKDKCCSCEIPSREQGKGQWRSGPSYAEGQASAFPAPENYCVGKKPNFECCIKQKDKVKLQEDIPGQNDPARSIRNEERKDEGCLDGVTEEQCLSWLEQRDHSGLTADHIETSSSSFCKCWMAFETHQECPPCLLLLSQFTNRQRKITITCPSQQNPVQLHFSKELFQY